MAQRITTIPEATRAVYAVMDKYSEFGAYDTEPRGVFANVVERVIAGIDPRVPQTVDGWQLYSGMKGNFFAAKALTRAAERVVRLAKASEENMDALVGFARRQGWGAY